MIALSAGRDVALRNTLEACALIDELGASAVGEILVHRVDGQRGTIFVERGRICWAAARGLARRLTELLGARAALAPGAMESMFTACKEMRVPLGEHLVNRGVLSAADLRVALLQHTTESLRALCTQDARAEWCPRLGKGYSPRFTFATAELLAHVGGAVHQATADLVRPTLQALFGDDEWGAAFVRTGSSAFPEPVAIQGTAPHAASTLVRVGKWAASALDIAAAFTQEVTLLATPRSGSAGETALVALRIGDAIVAGETGPHGPARILNRRAQQRRTRGNGNADL